MALLDTLTEITTLAPKCRIEKLLNKIEGEDLSTLQAALRNSDIRPFMLTTALRREYGQEAVTDKSVAEWRRRNLSELTGI